MSSRVCATGHVKDPVPLIEKSRALCPGGRFLKMPSNSKLGIHKRLMSSGF